MTLTQPDPFVAGLSSSMRGSMQCKELPVKAKKAALMNYPFPAPASSSLEINLP